MCSPKQPEAADPIFAPPPPSEVATKAEPKAAKKKKPKKKMASMTISRKPTTNMQSTGYGLNI